MLCEALLTYTGTLFFFHNYANSPDGGMMSAILFDILTHCWGADPRKLTRVQSWCSHHLLDPM